MDHSPTPEFVHFEFTLENFVNRPCICRHTEWLLLAVLLPVERERMAHSKRSILYFRTRASAYLCLQLTDPAAPVCVAARPDRALSISVDALRRQQRTRCA
jgi:hypothetical protein